MFLKTDNSKIGSAFAFKDRHNAVFLDLCLQMTVSGWLLPYRIDLGLTAIFNHLREARCFSLEKFHGEMRLRQAYATASRLSSRLGRKKKPARELRQEGSYYRCCIPALAGFVSPQSIAPDGGETWL